MGPEFGNIKELVVSVAVEPACTVRNLPDRLSRAGTGWN
jgi:hypothetical protein